MTYPPARRADLVVEAHGHRLEDPYRWLEERESAEAVAWLQAQDELFEQQRATWPALAWFRRQAQSQFEHGMVGLEIVRGNRTFLLSRPSDAQLSRATVTVDGVTRVLLDPVELDPSCHTLLDGIIPSPDGSRVAYLLSSGGDEVDTLYVIDTDTGEQLQEPIGRCHALYTQVIWLDADSFLLTRCLLDSFRGTEELEGSVWAIFRHTVGKSEPDEQLATPARQRHEWAQLEVDLERRRVLLTVSSMMPGTPTDLFVTDLDDWAPRPLLVGTDAETEAVWGPDGRVYGRSTLDAPRFQLIAVDPADGSWTALVPQHPTAILKAFAVAPLGVYCVFEQDHVSTLTLHAWSDGSVLETVPAPGRGALQRPFPRPDGESIDFLYGDFVTPQTMYRWRPGQQVPDVVSSPRSGDDRPLTLEHVEFPSEDGTLVPAVLFRRTDLTGPLPAAVYAYGGFGYSLLRPSFDHWGNAWAAAGGVWMVVGARGGGEKGEEWHRAGMRENKGNTFADVIAAGRWLVEQGIALPGQVGVSGLSNGALTAAGVIQKRPDAFAAAVACAMHADNLRGLRDPSSGFSEEYGDGTVPEEFGWLLAHSPYHNALQGTCYPALQVMAFGKDTRTVPEEGHKFTALMQWAQGCDKPVVLRHEEEAGHSTRSVAQMVDLLADWLAFLAAHVGLAPPE